MGKRI